MGFTLITLSVGLMGLWFYQKTSKLATITGKIEESLMRTLQLIKIEQDFFNNETLNPQFYRTGKSAYLSEHKVLLEDVKLKLYSLLDLGGIKQLYADEAVVTDEVKRIIQELEIYEEEFQKLAQLTREKGFQDEGLEGKMREKIHELEQLAFAMRLEDVLMIRRFEKDYFLRRDSAYAVALEKFVANLKTGLKPQPNTSSAVEMLLDEYLENFRRMVTLDYTIGTNYTNGIRGRMRKHADRTAVLMEKLVKEVNTEVIKTEIYSFQLFIFVTAFMILLSIVLSYVASAIITKPIVRLSKFIHKAVEKRFAGDIQLAVPRSKDEVGELTRDFNYMITEIQQRLREVKDQKKQLLKQYEELMEVNTHIRESESRLTKVNAVKDTFFSIISHDLRSPLNTLSGFLQILEIQADAFTPDEIQNFTQDVQKSLNRLLDLLENLLQWSRSQTDEVEYKSEKINLAETAQNNVDLYFRTAQEKGIKLISHITADKWVVADKNMLNFVFRNLISNAIKYSHAGSQIDVIAEAKGGFEEITVSDQGIGMTPQVLDRVFRPEEHLSTPGTNYEKGTGFGLSLCKTFIEKHNGHIEIDTAPEKGTAVKFTVERIEKKSKEDKENLKISQTLD
jgi:signal transduction histidine kinase